MSSSDRESPIHDEPDGMQLDPGTEETERDDSKSDIPAASPESDQPAQGDIPGHSRESVYPRVEAQVSSVESPSLNSGRNEVQLLSVHVRELGVSQTNAENPKYDENNEVPVLRQKIRDLEGEIERKEKERRIERAKLTAKVNDGVRKTQKLNQIIIDHVQQWKELMDDEIEAAAVAIRSAIVAIIRVHFAGRRIQIHSSKAKATKDSRTQAFYHTIKPLHPETIRWILKAEVFSILNREIFSRPIFGLDSVMDKQMENSMVHFERMIFESANISKQEAEEWRMRTVSHANSLGLPLTRKAEIIANGILEFLDPIYLSGPLGDTRDGKTQLFSELKALCMSSLKLALSFRSTKAKYRFCTLDSGTTLSKYPEKLYEIQRWDGPEPQEIERDRVRVVSTVFGALIKTVDAAGIGEETEIVLSMAHVAVADDSLQQK